MLNSFFARVTQDSITLPGVLLCTGVSLLLGVLIALIYMRQARYTKSFAVTLALLPAMVEIVILLVNGNLGTCVAVAGAFGLVRFRSLPGSAREIGSLFFAMAIGLATGMGYLGYAILFFLLIGAAMLLLGSCSFGEAKDDVRELKITIPESLDYDGIFDVLFAKYTRSAVLDRVKTTNMGSLYELTYRVELDGGAIPKAFLDELRCRNGNLTILCGRVSTNREELQPTKGGYL